MYKRAHLAGLLLAIIAAALVGSLPRTEQSHAAGPGTVISVTGHVPGSELAVEVVAIVPSGRSTSDVASEVLAAQGARPIGSSPYTTEGFTWPQFSNGTTSPSVIQYYNPVGDPTGVGQNHLTATQTTWSSVTESAFKFTDGGTTDRCPSLVRECPGPQTTDGKNDVGWLSIGGCCTLAVTWYTTSGGPETDMAINKNFSWATNGTSDYDLQTVMLHENGHVVGLGHSNDASAVMYAYYHGVQRTLAQDDINGLVALYPAGGSPPGPSATTVSVTAITYSTYGGKNQDKNLRDVVTLKDDLGNPVGGATVSISLSLDGSAIASGTGTTGSNGQVTFTLNNAPSGTYTTTVTSVSAGGLTWVGGTPANSFTKP